MNIDSARRAELAQEVARQDRIARDLDRLRMEENLDISSLVIEFDERINGAGYGDFYKGLWLGLTPVAINRLRGCDEQKI